jgi:hypothetical protein
MKHIKGFKIFESVSQILTDDQKAWLSSCCKHWGINRDTGLVDLYESFRNRDESITDLKGIKFGKAYKRFDISHSQIKSLEGSPRYAEDFICSHNLLESLEGGPERVKIQFDCRDNKLKSLEGAPIFWGDEKTYEGIALGSFNCSLNMIRSLKGSPRKVFGNFDCSSNELTSLEYAPEHVNGDFDCRYNQIESLEGSPRYIGNNLDFSRNKVNSLYGSPEKIIGSFNAYANPIDISALKYAPLKVGNLYYSDYTDPNTGRTTKGEILKDIHQRMIKEKKSYIEVIDTPYLLDYVRKNDPETYLEIKKQLPNVDALSDLGDLGF